MRDLFPVLVHALLFRGDALLLLRRRGTGVADGWYALPGGHLERGESVAACAARECREEAGIAVDVENLDPLAVLPYRSGEQQGVNILFACRVFDGEPRIGEPDRCDDIGFWPIDALPSNTVPYVARALHLRARGKWFLESDD